MRCDIIPDLLGFQEKPQGPVGFALGRFLYLFSSKRLLESPLIIRSSGI